ncbi:hypothetical protein PUN28_015385 [Cardiocondyla obscurior]|uniref:Uncharacterized protein n=1 Tax=Cardiocondyla obscurior TaxID=286306 RepID=A0AAW2ESS0_9HYME
MFNDILDFPFRFRRRFGRWFPTSNDSTWYRALLPFPGRMHQSPGRHRFIRRASSAMRRDADSRMLRLRRNVAYSKAIAGGRQRPLLTAALTPSTSSGPLRFIRRGFVTQDTEGS